MQLGGLLRFSLLSLLGFTLSGCIHYTHPSADGKPDAEVAIINQVDKSLAILDVDDDGTWFWLSRQSQYFIGAGTHRIRVWKYYSAQSHSNIVQRNVELVAGHTYDLTGESSRTDWDFQILDAKTGERADTPVPATETSTR